MYKHSYTAKVGFVKVLDRTCGQCGGMYSSAEKAVCPKCNAALVFPTFKHADGPRPYCMTEVVLYPLMRQDDRKDFETRTERSNSLGHFEVKMILWGNYDKATNTVKPDGRTQYLVAKRTIRVEFNTPPLMRPYTSGKHAVQQRVELKYTLNSNRGDELEFLDNKQEAQTMMAESKPAAATNPAATGNPSPAELQTQLNNLVQMVANMNAGGAPTAVQNTVVESPVPTDTTPSGPPADYDTDDGGIVDSPFPS